MAFGPLPLSQFAQIAQVSVEEVQLYLEHGILQPPRRRRGRSGATAYHQEHFDRLHFIKRALTYGFSLEIIAQFVDQDRMMTCEDVRRLTTSRLDELRRALGPVDRMVIALDRLLATCSGQCSGRNCVILTRLARVDHQ